MVVQFGPLILPEWQPTHAFGVVLWIVSCLLVGTAAGLRHLRLKRLTGTGTRITEKVLVGLVGLGLLSMYSTLYFSLLARSANT
jgi:hypothetical protein